LGDSWWRLAANSEHGIFHGIGLYSHWETRVRKGFNRLIDNRVGMSSPQSGTEAEDEHWMRQALALARRAGDEGEVPVGAVLVCGGALYAEGRNQSIAACDPTSHAEIVAIREAGRRAGNYRLPETTLYVTLEPCPMCAGAIVHARISRLVFAARDPRTGAAGSAFDLVCSDRLNHRARVTGGVLEEVAAKRLREFFAARRRSESA
jgi:tRNA(adenine34) deaminase